MRGVNLSLAYCDDCGHEELSMDVCPECGSTNLTKIERHEWIFILLPRQGRYTSERRKNGGNSGKEEHVICVIIILQKMIC